LIKYAATKRELHVSDFEREKTTKKQISLTNSQQKNNEITVPLDTNHLDRSWLKAFAS
tara:strand:- start:312 stop:485 length:174 start_codon:yes stop_codon:yes gene_type:complete